ncbi:putative transmembrane protein [Toxoplasma gondii RUB]|uniref:Putative transmembrane protein n=1 Tax=Toxoplasma gondii RUB TaxID=935652 RepID=A0A086LQG6_TOXGO|nr:putative transmembrane protein [Toxoplasma gondii RUB]
MVSPVSFLKSTKRCLLCMRGSQGARLLFFLVVSVSLVLAFLPTVFVGVAALTQTRFSSVAFSVSPQPSFQDLLSSPPHCLSFSSPAVVSSPSSLSPQREAEHFVARLPRASVLRGTPFAFLSSLSSFSSFRGSRLQSPKPCSARKSSPRSALTPSSVSPSSSASRCSSLSARHAAPRKSSLAALVSEEALAPEGKQRKTGASFPGTPSVAAFHILIAPVALSASDRAETRKTPKGKPQRREGEQGEGERAEKEQGEKEQGEGEQREGEQREGEQREGEQREGEQDLSAAHRVREGLQALLWESKIQGELTFDVFPSEEAAEAFLATLPSFVCSSGEEETGGEAAESSHAEAFLRRRSQHEEEDHMQLSDRLCSFRRQRPANSLPAATVSPSPSLSPPSVPASRASAPSDEVQRWLLPSPVRVYIHSSSRGLAATRVMSDFSELSVLADFVAPRMSRREAYGVALKMLERGLREASAGSADTANVLLENSRRTLPLRSGVLISDIFRKQAEILLRGRKGHEAVNAAIHAVEAAPEYAEAWGALGDAYRSLHRFWEARSVYEIASFLSPLGSKKFSLLLRALNRVVAGAESDPEVLQANLPTAESATLKMPTGLAVGANDPALGGCFVAYVAEDSRAEKAGIRPGMQIVAVGNKVLLGKPLEACLEALTFPTRPSRAAPVPSLQFLFFRGCVTDLFGADAFELLRKSGRLAEIFAGVADSEDLLRKKMQPDSAEANFAFAEPHLGALRVDRAYGRNADFDDFLRRKHLM